MELREEPLPSESRNHICPFSISVSCNWFTFWTLFYFLPPTIHSSLRDKNNSSTSDINHMAGMCLSVVQVTMSAITDQLHATNLIRINNALVYDPGHRPYWWLNPLAIGVAKRKLIKRSVFVTTKEVQFVFWTFLLTGNWLTNFGLVSYKCWLLFMYTLIIH